MPITRSAIKQLRQNRARNLRNRAARTNLRSSIKNVRAAIEGKDQALAKSALATAISVIDKAVGKGIVHKNVASRSKSRLSRHVSAL
jgi:small subunit ribosomal protein S20